jgi:hypothetical protein
VAKLIKQTVIYKELLESMTKVMFAPQFGGKRALFFEKKEKKRENRVNFLGLNQVLNLKIFSISRRFFGLEIPFKSLFKS